MAVRGMAAQGDRLARKMQRVPQLLSRYVPAALEQGAEEMVAQMRSFAPEWLRPSIKWTWGDAPSRAFVLDALSGGSEGGTLKVTIYSDDFRARWFEFGTGERVQKSTGRRVGRITAQPFFFPGYRFLRRRARNRIGRAVSRAFREAMAGQ